MRARREERMMERYRQEHVRSQLRLTQTLQHYRERPGPEGNGK